VRFKSSALEGVEMKTLLIVILLVFPCCLGCQQEPQSVSPGDGENPRWSPDGKIIYYGIYEADIQAIKDLILEFMGVFNTADIDKILTYYEEGIVRIQSNSPATVGKDAIRTAYEQLFDEYRLQEEYLVKDVQVSGNLAVAHVAFTYNATPKDSQDSIESKGNEIMVLKRQADSTWKFIYLIWSDERLIFPE
jgi:uncharacterized protein (TIGR02246 family)